MNTLKIVSLAAVAASLLTAAAMPAVADRGHGGWGGPGWHHHAMGPHKRPHAAMRFMEWFDTDRDGKVTQAEIDAVISEQFTKADADGSGGVSLDEFKVAFAEIFSQDRVRAFQRLDRDGDGKVTEAEYNQPVERMITRMERGHGFASGESGPGAEQGSNAERGPGRDRGPGMRGPGRHHRGMAMMLLERFDADGDGSVTPQEVRTVRAEAFTAADKDGDKALTLVEFGQIWAQRSDRRMVRGFQRFDRDGDLEITKAEAERPFANLVQRLDRNDDGALSIDDRGHHRKKMRSRGDK